MVTERQGSTDLDIDTDLSLYNIYVVYKNYLITLTTTQLNTYTTRYVSDIIRHRGDSV